WRSRDNQPGGEAQTWVVGQLVTARASLRLLRHRAESKGVDQPWPEFAEYNCFACHHDLRDRAWRRDPARFGKRPPGSLAWNERYVLFLPDLLSLQTKETKVAHTGLAEQMAQPRPDRSRV